MFINYLKIAFRTLWNNKLYSLINILGLGIAMAVVLLIAVYVSYQLSFDKFHPDAENIYRLTLEFHDTEWTSAQAQSGVAPHLKKSFAEVKDFTRICNTSAAGTLVIPTQDEDLKFVEEKSYYADSNIFKFFHLPIIKGNAEEVLNDPFEVVISTDLAEKYFGKLWKQDENIIGKYIKLTNFDYHNHPHTITGIFKKQPNSHFQPDLIMSMSSATDNIKETVNKYGGTRMYCYFNITNDAKLGEIKQEADTALRTNSWGFAFNTQFQPLSEIYFISDYNDELEEGGNRQLNYFLVIVGLVIMICAWVNYVNMSIAQAMKRVKEVGVRKSIGAGRANLISQFLVEGFFVNVMGGLLAINLAALGWKMLQFATNVIPWEIWINGESSIIAFLILLMALIIFGTLFAGFYPALILASFNPVKALKGMSKTRIKGKVPIRFALLSLQFAISALLVIGIFVVYYQLNYMFNKSLGFDKEQKLIIEPAIHDLNSVENYVGRAKSFKNEVAKLAGVSAITSSSSVPGKPTYGWRVIRKKPHMMNGMDNVYTRGNTPDIIVDKDFFDFYDIDLKMGRYFPEHVFEDTSSVNDYILVNEEFARSNGYEPKELLGKVVYDQSKGEGNFAETEIIGIVKNYHHYSVKEDYVPLMFTAEGATHYQSWANKKVFRTSQLKFFSLLVDGVSSRSQMQNLIGSVEKMWNDLFPEIPFEYSFLDDSFNSQYQEDLQLSKVFGLFAGLGIFISCLGLFGLSSFLIQQRTKEIGIRKILGASLKNLFTLLSKNYIRLVTIASLISVPLAYWGIEQWLQNYAFRIDVSWWFFVVPLLVLLAIAIITISFKIISTAKANPVEALRYE